MALVDESIWSSLALRPDVTLFAQTSEDLERATRWGVKSPILCTRSYASWRDEIKHRVDVVLSGRFHGAVASLHAGKPTMVLCSSVRVREMCGSAGIPIWPHDVRDVLDRDCHQIVELLHRIWRPHGHVACVLRNRRIRTALTWKEVLRRVSLNVSTEILAGSTSYTGLSHLVEQWAPSNNMHSSFGRSTFLTRCIDVFERLPADFDVHQYLELNPDLRAFRTPFESMEHYVNHGTREGRIYTEPKVNIDVAMYRHFNVDLRHMTTVHLKAHWHMHGRAEGRKCVDELFDEVFAGMSYSDYVLDVRRPKSLAASTKIGSILEELNNASYDVVLVDHDSSNGSGASIYLSILARYLIAKESKRVIVLTNKQVQSAPSFFATVAVSYDEDAHILYHLLRSIPTRVIVVNSCNVAILHGILPYYKSDFECRVVLHSHEVMDHYLPWTQFRISPDFVVSDDISLTYKMNGCASVQVQPPLLDSLLTPMVRCAVNLDEPKRVRDGETLPHNSKCVLMIGQLTHRKNPRLFAELSDQCPDHTFLWIGSGDIDASVAFGESNVYHVPYTHQVLAYARRYAGLFLLTSFADPFPYAVLEMLRESIPIAYFEGAQVPRYPALNGMCHCIPGMPSVDSALAFLGKFGDLPAATPAGAAACLDFLKGCTELRAGYKDAICSGSHSDYP
jgi:glycosyltransferase involved in cell wall biosynthesis